MFTSFIWNDRYCGYGDFEINLSLPEPGKPSPLDYLSVGYYLVLKGSVHVMVVEDFQISSTVDRGDTLKVTGRSLESLLDRRVVWNKTVLTGNFQNGIKRLLNENAINPTNPARQIPGLVFRDSVDPAITALEINTQFYGEGLYDAILTLCTEQQLGFRIVLEGTQMIFELYDGVDRSDSQTVRPMIEFSGRMDNLTGSNYAFSMAGFKNTAKVVDKMETVVDDEDPPVVTEVTIDDTATGLNRREVFYNTSGISKTYEDGTDIPANVYLAQLQQQGLEGLYATTNFEVFDGELDATHEYVYGRDFLLGDIVQFENAYNMRSTVRVVEVIRSQEISGERIIPSFSTVT